MAHHHKDSDWFDFTPESDNGESVIGMEGWLDAPAGKHGFCRAEGDRLVFEDGTPVKFWGLNNCNMGCAPPRDEAMRRAAHYAKYGVNGVRMHKYANTGHMGICSKQSVLEFDAEKMDRFDYYHAKLRDTGIYYTWSHVFRLKPRPEDCKMLEAPDEVVTYEEKGGELVASGNTVGLMFVGDDIQQLHLQLARNLLDHENPYTGLRYADDPALACFEFHNEDDIFFYTTIKAVENAPTYKRIFCRKFSRWLKTLYGSHDALVEAWGEHAIDAYPEFMEGEHLERENIYPVCNCWYFGPEGLKNEQRERGTRKRLLDTARFCYELQRDYYDRFEQMVRGTGYGGALVGSCWQAGEAVPHYYNLHTDYEVGVIDRHNYFGGSGSHHLETGPLNNASMLTRPGSGLLSTGMQQVVDRPFALSEWIVKIPTEWVAEGPPTIAAYGMGLQGWDASFEFASDKPEIHDTINSRTAYNVESPTQIGQYPALARMVLRGDVSEGDVVSVRRVSLQELTRGEISFEEHMDQDGDIKSMGGDVPAAALAVGRNVVEFTDEPQESTLVALPEHTNETGALVSTTGELRWRPGASQGGGWFSVDTPGTQGVVGFLPRNEEFALGDVTITVDNPFAVVLVTALGRDGTLADAPSALAQVVARARNTGMEYNEDHTELLDTGHAPVQLEAVRATVKFARPGPATVHVLDHDGRRQDVSRVMDAGALEVNGAEDRTMYYEVVWE
jgi:hypothetical protein